MNKIATTAKARNGFFGYTQMNLPLLLMLIPGLVWVILFVYYPLAGNVIAFKKFVVTKGIWGSEWLGLGNFESLMRYPNFDRIMYNTVFIAVSKIVLGLVVAVIFALMLNEVSNNGVRRTIQTIVYLPNFLSWVILSDIMVEILSGDGIVNSAIRLFGGNAVNFLGDAGVFPYTIIVSDIWKSFGYNAIIYLAALTAIDPTLYEAAVIDGAGRWRQTWHITLPGIQTSIVLMSTLALGNVLNAGFEQIFTLYSPAVYSTGDIIDTVVYRLGMVDARYGVSTAASLFKSAISLVLVAISYKLADKFAGYQIF